MAAILCYVSFKLIVGPLVIRILIKMVVCSVITNIVFFIAFYKSREMVVLKNIVIKNQYRRQGLGKKMLKYLADNYKARYKKMIVGTTENNIPFSGHWNQKGPVCWVFDLRQVQTE